MICKFYIMGLLLYIRSVNLLHCLDHNAENTKPHQLFMSSCHTGMPQIAIKYPTTAALSMKLESEVCDKEHSSFRADTMSCKAEEILGLKSKPLSRTFLEDDTNEYNLEKVTKFLFQINSYNTKLRTSRYPVTPLSYWLTPTFSKEFIGTNVPSSCLNIVYTGLFPLTIQGSCLCLY